MTRPVGDIEAGAVLGGRYRLEERLGEGAMGEVWRARQLLLDRDVAVKVVRGDRLEERARRRLHREARAVARISHPNVVQVHDYGRADGGRPFFVMERVPGPSASTWAQEQRSAGEVLRAVISALDGLAAAHACGVLHRDLKPANMLLRDGDPDRMVLVDFGIAAILRGEDEEEPGDAGLTEPGRIVGTPLYMAPEQATGGPVGPRSDVYAMGVILYEWLTGAPPFRGSALSVLHAHLSSPPPPFTPRVAVPPGVEGIVTRALAKHPLERWRSAAQLRNALAGLSFRGGAEDLGRSTPAATVAATIDLSGATGTGGASRGTRAAAPASSVPGREREAAGLRALVEGALAEGGIIVVEGAAGIGKSHLAREVIGQLRQVGRTRVGQALFDRAEGSPLSPVGAALEDALELRAVASEDLAGALSRSAVGTAPSLGGPAVDPGRLAEWLRPAPAGPPPERSTGLHSLIERALRAASTDRPLLLVLEDADHAGAPFDRLLERLAAALRLEPARLALLVVRRSEPGDRSPSESSLARFLGSTVHRLSLDPLSDSGVEAVLRSVAPVSVDAAARISAVCGGSPTPALHLLRHLVDNGTLVAGPTGLHFVEGKDPDELPRSLDSILGARVERALAGAPDGEAARDVLEAIATLGNDVDVPLLVELLAAWAPEAAAEVDALIDGFVHAGLLREPPGRDDRVTWDSDVLRTAVLAAPTSTRRRRRLCRAAAAALASRSDGPARDRAIAELLIRGGADEEAGPHAIRAGAAALDRGDRVEARRLFSWAARSKEPLRRARAELGVASADLAAGRIEEVIERLTPIARTGPLTLRSEAHRRIGAARLRAGDKEGAGRSLRAALQARVTADDADPATTTAILRTLVALDPTGSTGPLPSPPPLPDNADDRLRAEDALRRATLATARGDTEAAIRALDDAVRWTTLDGRERSLPAIRHDLSVALRRAGRAARARQEVAEALESARRLRLHPVEAKLHNEAGELSRARGDLPDAAASYRRAVELWDALGDPRQVLGRLNLALVEVERGEAAAARALIPSEEPARFAVPWALTSARVAVALHEDGEAEALLRRAAELLPTGRRDEDAVSALQSIARAWSDRGEEARALALRSRFDLA